MKVLVIGSGGREHALVWKLAQSARVDKVYAAPGNGGTATEEKAENFSLGGADPASEEGQKILLDFARSEKIELTVVGPEAPLAAGIVDKFRAAGLAITGPDQNAARLERSKLYAKSFMEKYGVSTAKAKSFKETAGALDAAEKHFGKGNLSQGKAAQSENPLPLVIKADGLAAGKGVIIATDAAEAKKTIQAFMKDGQLGEAGKNLLLEEYLEGFEFSIMAAASVRPGKKGAIKPFIPARDYKRLFDGNLGPNTGGMGAIAPAVDFTRDLQKDFVESILLPTLQAMEAEKMDYRGFIYFGLMACEGKCYLLEYNVRLGDPETQVLFLLLQSDFVELNEAILNNTIQDFSIKWKNGAACAAVAAAGGYPGSYRKGDNIAINPTAFGKTGAKLFVAGADRGAGGALGSGLRTTGGRVLSVSALGANHAEASAKMYGALRFVSFEDMIYRKDIGREQDHG